MTGREIRSREEVRNSETEIRRYRGGTLYAYRDDDEHVVVLDGNESWTKRVPARRTATIPDERLWTIPDNWTKKLEIANNDGREYAVFRIPETEVDLLVSTPVSVDANEAWYGVEAVGELRFSISDTLDQYGLSTGLTDLELEEDHNEDVLEALRRTERQWLTFKREYENYFEDNAPEAFWNEVKENDWDDRDRTPRIDGRSIDLWEELNDVNSLLVDALDIDEDISATVAELLVDVGAIPDVPTVELTVVENETLPDGFDLQALIEAGCSPDAAVDYAMVVRSEKSPHWWAAIRNVDPDVVGDNIREARQQLQR